MIKKSILFCIILLCIHFLIVVLIPKMGMPTHQGQDNVVKAQTFMYSHESDTVMVGTSLSARILRDSVPSVKSISFGGCSVEDGLRIITKTNNLPRYVLVETNLFLHSGNPDLVSRTTEGLMPKLRACIPSLREQYQPICLFAWAILGATNINPQAAVTSVDIGRLNESIKHAKEVDKTMSDDEVKERIDIIFPLMKNLEAKGIRFIFFEMPVNAQLVHLKQFEQSQQVVRQLFPVNKYTYLTSDTASYLTSDGIHLDFEGQQRFSHYFSNIIKTEIK